jgi:hypothetical protein
MFNALNLFVTSRENKTAFGDKLPKDTEPFSTKIHPKVPPKLIPSNFPPFARRLLAGEH